MVDDFIDTIREQLKNYQKREKGGPRSKLVDAIMVLLLSKPMRSAEIAGLLGLDTKYVSSYLSYWKTRGYVEYSSGFWFLTEKGEEYAQEVAERASDEKFDRMALLAQKILASESINATRKDKKRKTKTLKDQDSLSFIVALKRKPENKLQERAQQAACIIDLIKNELNDDELELFTALLSHYTKWGNTYMYIDQLAELLKADYRWLLRTARELQTKNLIYIYTDPKLGMRIGLSKQAKALLEECGF